MNRITLSAAAATVLAVTNPAQADVRVGVVVVAQRDGYRNRVTVERIAFDQGYRDGLREGERDDRRDDRFGYRDEVRYREGDAGYRREYGPRYAYMSAYRRGFVDGYRRGYATVQSRARYDDRYARDYRR